MKLGMEDQVIKQEKRDERSVAVSRCSIIGKIVADRMVNRKGVLNILKGIWPVEVAPVISEVRSNKYGISFKINEVMEKALDEGPWLVIGYCFTI
ncbi:hypothetical protein CRYUN_Cryun05aG0062500 [Craigia yunnanensis]